MGEWQMIKAIIGIGVALVWITFFALAKAAGINAKIIMYRVANMSMYTRR